MLKKKLKQTFKFRLDALSKCHDPHIRIKNCSLPNIDICLVLVLFCLFISALLSIRCLCTSECGTIKLFIYTWYVVMYFVHYHLKRLHLVKTTSWQHRFLDLTNLAPMWLRTYEYMKSTLQNYFFRFETGLPESIFQIWPKATWGLN